MKQKIGQLVSVFFYPFWLLVTVLGSAYMIEAGQAEATTVTFFFFLSFL